MTLTVRNASVTGATTAARELTHAEMDANWDHVANFTQSGTGATSRTAQAKLRDVVSVFDFFTTAQVNDVQNRAAAVDVGTAITTALATLSSGTLYFPNGTYSYATSPNFAKTGLTILCDTGVIFNHTGTGNAFSVDGGAAGSGIFNMRIENAKVQGNTNSTNGFFFRAIHHSVFSNLHVIGCATTGSAFLTNWCVQNTFINPTVSLNQDGGLSPKPLHGMYLTRRDAGEPTTTTTLINPIFQGLNAASGSGLTIDYSHEAAVFGGVFSTCTTGVVTTANDTNGNNKFFLPHFESNTTDMTVAAGNILNGVYGAVFNGSLTLNSNSNLLDHCTIAGTLTIGSGATRNVIRDTLFAVLSDSGTNTLYRGAFNTTTSLLQDEEQAGTWTPSLGGTATYTTQFGRWKKIGRMVFIEGRLVVNSIGTGSTTVISGLPFTVSNDATGHSLPCYYWTSLAVANVMYLTGATIANTTTMHFLGVATAGTPTLPAAIFQNSAEVRFSGWYEAAS